MTDGKKKNPFDQTPTEDQQKGGEATATDMPEDMDVSDVEEDTSMEEDSQMEQEDEEKPSE